MYVSLLLLAAAVSALFLIPFPMRVWAPFEIRPHAAASVYVEVPGRLVEIAVKPGDKVEPGDLIAQLENLDLKMKVAQLEGQRESLRAQLRGLQDLQPDPSRTQEASYQLAHTQEGLASVEKQLAEQLTDLNRLRVVAPVDGTVIPPPRTPERPGRDEVELPAWTGTPLDEKNLGATLSPEGPQNLICQIGDPNQWYAALVIDQDDVDLVQRGREVRLMLEESAYHVFVSIIAAAPTSEELTVAPPRLASTNGGPLPAQPNPDGTVRPLNTSYQAEARLDNSHGLLRNGLIGMARIEAQPRSLFWRLKRYIGRTFNFEL